MTKRYLFIAVISLLVILGSACKVQATELEDSGKSVDSKAWEMIPRDGYAEYVEFGSYEYYFTCKVNSGKYKIYRRNIETGKSKCILKYNRKNSYGNGCTFYTNGKKLVIEDSNLIYCMNADGTGSKKKVLDLRKKGDDLSAMSIYGNKIYYSTYHIYDMYYKSYSINISGKGKKVISKSYAVSRSSDRYIPMYNKKGGMVIYDAVTGKMRSLYKSGEVAFARVDDYWYYAACKNPDAKIQKITLYKKSASGKGKAKKLAVISKKNKKVDAILEINKDGIYFGSGDGEVSFYSLKAKKFKKTDRDIWYYIADAMTYE